MAYTRVTFRGVTLNTRTRDMILAAEKILGWQLVPTQGSYNRGGVAASAGTHDGGGAVDFRARTLTAAKKTAAVVALRRVGFAAWLRLTSEGDWVEHIHCIAIGDAELSRGAKNQVTAYKAGRNGLANNRADNATRAYVNVTWESYKASIAEAATKLRVSLSNIAYAANGGFFRSGQLLALTEARRVVDWIGRLGIATDRDIRVWNQFVAAGNWPSAGLQYAGIIKKFQKRYGLVVDGKVGPQTKAKLFQLLTHDGYRVVA